MKRIVLYILCVLLFAACGGKGPQRPSRWIGREAEPDSTVLNLLELNRRMATAADQELLSYVRSHEGNYALYNGGVWVRTIEQGNEELKPYGFGHRCRLHLRVYMLNEQRTLLSDVDQTFKLGEAYLPLAVTDVVREKHPGARVEMLVPWYSAYGLRGNENIPPYQNVIIDLTIGE